MIQVGSSTAGDESKPTSEKLKEGDQDLLGKFVEEQLKNIKITNVEEQLKTTPKVTKVNKAIQCVEKIFRGLLHIVDMFEQSMSNSVGP